MYSVGCDDFLKKLSLFFARLSARHLVPESTVDTIAEELCNISILQQSIVKQNVSNALNGHPTGGKGGHLGPSFVRKGPKTC